MLRNGKVNRDNRLGHDRELCRLGSTRCFQQGEPPREAILFPALDDPEPEVRWRAAMALGWMRNFNAISILRARLANEKDETVRENIEASLKRLAALQKNGS